MNTTKVEISFPFIKEASDYHEFDNIKDMLRSLSNNKKIKFTELGFDDKIGYYIAVFYVGSQPSKEEIQVLLEPYELE